MKKDRKILTDDMKQQLINRIEPMNETAFKITKNLKQRIKGAKTSPIRICVDRVNKFGTIEIFPGVTLLNFAHCNTHEFANQIMFLMNLKIYLNDDGQLNSYGYMRIAKYINNIHPYLNKLMPATSIKEALQILDSHEFHGFEFFIPGAVKYATNENNSEVINYIYKRLGLAKLNDDDKKNITNIVHNIDSKNNMFNTYLEAYNYAMEIINNVFLPPLVNCKTKEKILDKRKYYYMYKKRFDLIDFKHHLIEHDFTLIEMEKFQVEDNKDAYVVYERLSHELDNKWVDSETKSSYPYIDNVCEEFDGIINKSMNQCAFYADSLRTAIRIEIIEILKRKTLINECESCGILVMNKKTCKKCSQNVYTKRLRDTRKKTTLQVEKTKWKFDNMFNRLYHEKSKRKNMQYNKMLSENDKTLFDDITTLLKTFKYYAISIKSTIYNKRIFTDADEDVVEYYQYMDARYITVEKFYKNILKYLIEQQNLSNLEVLLKKEENAEYREAIQAGFDFINKNRRL
jgi:hypothetical protein